MNPTRSPHIEAFLSKNFPNATLQDWDDWKWQLRHQYKRLDTISRVLTLDQDEADALSRADGFTFGVNPYYASLLESNPQGPLRRTIMVRPEEWVSGVGEGVDPLGEEPYRPVSAIVHRYPDRALFLATGTCALYCRYCTRARLVGDPEAYRSEMKEWEKGFAYLRAHPVIRDVLITGGDPLTLSDDRLDFILENLRAIPHIEFIRMGTKVPFALPQRVTPELCAVLKKYHPLYLSVHVIHPSEITPESRVACERLADAGLPLGSQTVLLKGVNDQVSVLTKLMHELLKIRVKPYYLFHCDPVSGSSHFRTSVERGLEMIQGMRGHTTGYAIPHYAIDMAGSGGKVAFVPEAIIGRENGYFKVMNFRGEVHLYPDGDDHVEMSQSKPQQPTLPHPQL